MRQHAKVTSLVIGTCVALTLSACVTPPAPAPETPPALSLTLSDGVHWFRDSAEQKAVYLETYREAAESARTLSRGLEPQSWAVILDIDETVLDNSEYQKRQALSGQHFSSPTWNAWIEERAATPLPGAKRFIDTVIDELHGQVIFVTNRKQDQCSATEDNLHHFAIGYSRILCDRVGDQDKNARFQAVMNGEPGVTAPLNVLIWIGDNIQDFPTLTQATPGDLQLFGTRYFALPDPMYGSWQNVPPH
jgi:5'-nucleotidase (lipoprotein e(P4) family)